MFMISHLLFDLDGTLLPVDNDFFFHHYLNALRPKFSHLIPAEEFDRHLLGSTMKMVADRDPTRTNEEVFWSDFPGRVGRSREELEPLFLQFYHDEFPRMQRFIAHARANRPGPVREILDRALRQGFSLVLATNAIFPETAVRERLSWINCHDLPFRLITSFERMHFCKPNPEYYREILRILKIPVHRCLMIGNDPEEDLAAAFLGMKTCLVTDYLIKRDNVRLKPDFSCRLAELAGILERIR